MDQKRDRIRERVLVSRTMFGYDRPVTAFSPRLRFGALTCFACLPCVAILVACTGDSPNLVGTDPDEDGGAVDGRSDDDSASPVDATSDTDRPDGGDDADDASDGNLCKETPEACRSPMQTCANVCRQTYGEQEEICQMGNPANLQACIDARRAELASCQQPCKTDCVTCANANGSCTGTPDCSEIVYVP